jgi:putative ABC transport system ATP-binding protein
MRKGIMSMEPETPHNPRDTAAKITAAALQGIDIRKSLPLGRERIDILKGVDLRIEHGEFVAIVGSSGSGKSTLLGIMAGLDNPTSGQVLVDSVDITHMSEGKLAAVRNQKIGMISQARSSPMAGNMQ